MICLPFDTVVMGDRKISKLLWHVVEILKKNPEICSQCECLRQKCAEMENEVLQLKLKSADKSLLPPSCTQNVDSGEMCDFKVGPGERTLCDAQRTHPKSTAETESTTSESSFEVVDNENNETFEELAYDSEEVMHSVESVGEGVHSEFSSPQAEPDVCHTGLCDCVYARVSRILPDHFEQLI